MPQQSRAPHAGDECHHRQQGVIGLATHSDDDEEDEGDDGEREEGFDVGEQPGKV